MPVLGRLGIAYLILLPVGQILLLPVAGAVGTASDIALMALVLAGGLAVMGRMASPSGWAGPDRLAPDYRIPLVLLAGFAAWVAVSGVWGFHPGYAAAKGGGLLLLVAGAYVLAVGGAGAERLADGWLLGAALAVGAAFVAGAVGPELVRERVLYDAGMVDGLPVPRLRGPFVHPNLFGDYLAVSGLLLWARWPDWSTGWRRPAAIALAAALAAALLLTVSTGWLTAGAGLLALSVGAPGWRRAARVVAGVAGAGVAAATLAGVLFPIEVALGPLRIATGGIRPGIWSDAAAAVLSGPLIGVGAAPYLAETADPGGAGAPALWDAHSTYLSVLGQFGLLGALLFFGGVAMAVRAAGLGAVYRLRLALLAIAAGTALHWTSIAGEDFRHLWALVGLAGAMGVSRRGAF